MKKLVLEILIISMLVLVPSATLAADKATVNTDEHLAVVLLLDRSDVGKDTWKRSLILARQTMSLLKTGDELILITSSKDRNVIETTCRIDPDNADQRTRLNQQLMALKYKWWSRAELPAALQLAYNELNNRPSGRKCCIVISDGRYDNSAVEDIRRKATVYRLSGIPLLMTVVKRANQNLFLAGNQKELNIVVLEQTDLADWFEKVRPHRNISAAAITPPSPPLESVAPLPVIKPPVQPPIEKPVIKKPPVPAKEHKSVNLQLLHNIWPFILLAVIVFCIYWIASNWVPKDIKDEIKDSPDLSQHLIAEYRDKLRDLGELASVTTLVFGKLISSAVPLDDQEVNDKEFEISPHGQMLRIRNRANADLTVNGLALKSGKNMELTLPAMIKTASGVRISFYIEDSVQNTELIMKE